MGVTGNNRIIGAFVVGAVVLLVAAVVALGGGELFKEKNQYVLYFDGSVKGLNVGAPVLLKGVKVGAVTDISLFLSMKSLTARTQVIVEIYEDAAVVEGDVSPQPDSVAEKEAARRRDLARLIDAGLRAQLQVQSFVTGLLMVSLDFFPNSPSPQAGNETGLLEIPTVGSGMDKLSRTLDQIVGELNETMKGIAGAINAEETKQTLTALNKAMAQLSELTRKLNEQAEPTLTGVQDLMKDARTLVSNIDDEIDPLATGLKELADSATNTVQQGDRLIAGLQGLAPRDSALAFGIADALRSMTRAMDSIRDLASYLEQHPEALLSGKSGN
jgi:paraquat-inducible protein B